MTDKDLTPRVLAGLALGKDPAKFMSFRLMPDGERGYASVVVIDSVGRKFILSDADLTRVYAEVVERRLKARGKALVDELKKEAAEISSAPALVKVERKPATGKTPAHSGAKKTSLAAAKPKTAAAPKAKTKAKTEPKPKTKPGSPPSVPPKKGDDSGT